MKHSFQSIINRTITTAGLLLACAFVPGHAVQVAPNDIGQVLLGSSVYAGGGLASNITISNTSSLDAVKAFVNFRDPVKGDTFLGFVIYLAPMDSFTGQLRSTSEGSLFITTDDSLSLGDFFPSNSSPFSFSSQWSSGFIEVIGAYAVRGQIGTPSGPVNITNGMSKTDLFKVFSTDRANLTPSTDTPNTISSVTPSMVALTGKVEVQFGISGASYTSPMVALEQGYNSITGGVSTKVINNPRFDVSVGVDAVNMGERFGTNQSPEGDNIVDIEAAIAAVQKLGYFEASSSNFSLVNFVFPTKYRHLGRDVCSGGDTTSGYSAPFNSDGGLQYEIIVNDLSGNLSSETASSCTVAPCPVAPTKNTFNSMLFEPVPSGFFSTGQAKLGFFEKNGCSYLGVPVLADVMRTQFSGSSQNVQNQPMASIASGLKVAERIFNWAERAFPDWFILLSATVTQGNEAIRCYSGVLGNLCLAEKAGKILVRWPTGKTQDLGSSSDYLREARNAGF